MTQTNGPSQTEGGQVHRTLDEWNALASQLGHKDLATLLKHRYHVLKESTHKIAAWFNTQGVQITPLRVRQLMRRLGIKRRPAGAVQYPKSFWRGVDWSKSNQDLADEKGVDPATVRRWRERLGKDKQT